MEWKRWQQAAIPAVLAFAVTTGGADAMEIGEWVQKEGKWVFESTEDPVLKLLRKKGIISDEEYAQLAKEKEKEKAERDKQVKSALKGVVTHDQKKKWVDSVTWSGDLLLRHEQTWRVGNPKDANGSAIPGTQGVDRSRQRFRLRFGPEIRMGDFKVTVQIGTSTSTDGINGDQSSLNQSFDNGFSQKEIFIHRAYATWNPSFFRPMTIYGGKMKNPFYTQYTNDLLFDPDVSPEGLAESFFWKLTDAVALFANFGQFALDEDALDQDDQFLLAYQGGTELTIAGSKIRLALGYFDNQNLQSGGLSEPNMRQFNSKNAANPTNATSYVNEYKVLSLTGRLETEVLGIPLLVAGDYLKNTSGVISCANNAGNSPGRCGNPTQRFEGQDQGYEVGVRVGRASKANTWEGAYYYRWLQADATLSAFTDSEPGDGGTNQRGNIFWVGYSPTDFLRLQVKFYNTKPLEKGLCFGSGSTSFSCTDNINKMQIDAVFAF